MINKFLRKRFFYFLLLLLAAAICIFRPVSGQTLNVGNAVEISGSRIEETARYLDFSETIDRVKAAKARGHYHHACTLLVMAIARPASDCDDLIHNERSPEFDAAIAQFFPVPSAEKIAFLRELGNVLHVLGGVRVAVEFSQESVQLAEQDFPSERSRSLLVLGNAKVALAHRKETLNNAIEADILYREAIGNYREAIATANDDREQLRASLLLFHLLAEVPIENVENIADKIRDRLQTLEDDRFTMFARTSFANSLTCLKIQEIGRDRLEKQFNSLPPMVRHCTRHIEDSHSLNGNISWEYIAQILTKSARLAKDLDNSHAESYAIGYLAEIYELNEQYSDAIQLAEKAVNIALSIDAKDIAYRWQWQLARLHDRAGNRDKAKQFYQNAIDSLKDIRSNIAILNPESRYDFRDNIEPVYREFANLLLREETPSPEELKTASDTIKELQRAEIEDFLQAACRGIEQRPIEEIDPKAAIFHTIAFDDRLEVIVFFPDGSVRRHRVDEGGTNSEFTVKILHAGLSHRNWQHINWESQVLQPAQQLYNWLVAPVKTELENNNVETLVFVLDGVLRNIPMSALHDGDRYLIEDYAIAIAPGIELYEPTNKRHRWRVLAAGRSNFDDLEEWNNLTNVTEEIEAIDNILPTDRLLEASFTPEAIAQRIRSSAFSIVHIATHAKFTIRAEDTFIQTGANPVNLNQLTELLRVGDRTGERNLDLLVFSACQTATGNDRAILGLAGAGLRSGARSVLGSLWNVNDRSTAELMRTFYRELNAEDNPSKAEALRRAQLSLLYSDSKFSNPHFWSPFVLVGSWL